MKRKWRILVLAVSAALGLAGCGGIKTSQDAAVQTNQAEGHGEKGEALSVESCTLTMWTFPFGTDGQTVQERENYEKIAAGFEAENPGVKVNVEVLPWSNRETKMLTAIAAGQGPDLMYLNPDILKLFKAYGVLAPVTDYISQDTLAEFPQNLLDNSVLFGGELYGLPCLVDLGTPCYNLDLLEQIGMTEDTLPTTWTEYDAMLAACKEKGITGVYYNYSSTPVSNSAYAQFFSEGCAVIREDGTVVIDDEAGKRVLRRLADWYQKGYTPADSLSVFDDDATFMSGAAASCLSSKGAGFYRRLAPDITFRWAAGPILKGEAGQFGLASTVGSLAVAKNCSNVEAAAKFLEYFSRDEINGDWCDFGGYISPKNGAVNPNMELKGYDIILKNLDVAKGEPNHAASRTMSTVFIPDLQAIVTGTSPFDEGVAKIKRDIEGIVAQVEQISN